MKRAVLISGLAALAATVLPVPALADASGSAATAGGAPCSVGPVPAGAPAAAPVGTEACPWVRPRAG